MATLDDMIQVVYKCKICYLENDTIETLRHHVKEVHQKDVLCKEASTDEELNETTTKQINIIIEDADNFNVNASINTNKSSPFSNSVLITSETEEQFEENSMQLKCTENVEKEELLNSASHNHETVSKKCTLCNMRFKDKEELNLHQNSHYDDNTFKCLKCDYVNSQWTQVKKHIKIHENSETICTECGMTFACQLALKSHWRYQHLGGKHLCDTCGYEASSKFILFQHKSQCHSVQLSCYRCNFTCHNEVDLQKHNKMRHESGFVCKYCKPTQIFPTQHHLHTHMTTIHPGKKCFICDRCNYVAKLRHHLEKHYLMHTGERPLKCQMDGCNFTAREPRHFKQHMLTKHSKPGELVCKECQFVTSDQNQWDLHISMKHMKIYQCKHCDFQTKNSATLRRHRLAKHVDQDQMRFPCAHCSYKTNFRDNFNKHLLTHVLKNEKHKCPICKTEFDSRSEVKNHLLRTHTKHEASQVQFCNMCAYSCKNSSVLKQHKLTHSDEKLYKCEKCTYSSKTKVALRNHVMRRHRERS